MISLLHLIVSLSNFDTNGTPYLYLVDWKDLLMMSGFGSYYLNLVSITFYTIPTSISFFRENVFKILGKYECDAVA